MNDEGQQQEPPTRPELPGLGGKFPRGCVFVEGFRLDGQYGEIDVLDLTESSWRAFVLDALAGGPASHLLARLRVYHAHGMIPYFESKPVIQREAAPAGQQTIVHREEEAGNGKGGS